MGRISLAASLGACLAVAALAWAPPASASGVIVVGDKDPVPGEAARASPIRLAGHTVTATFDDAIADVTVEQVFHSGSDRVLEGTYLFPLPEGAVVSGFAMTMGGKMVEGEVVEAKEARHVYEGIVRKMKDPGLLEWAGRGLFRARVYPIEPGGDVRIRLSFQQVLGDDSGTLEWRYPLDSGRFGASSEERVKIDVSITSSVDVKSAYSPSHRVEVVRDGERRVRVAHVSGPARQDRDFLLYVARSAEDVGLSAASHKSPGEDGTFMAVLAPKAAVPADRLPKDVVFVLDTSGSMQGHKMEQARAALAFGIRTLKPADRFNLLAFSTSVRPFREGLSDATDATKEEAVSWLSGLEATGGTNIEGALAEALRMRATTRLPVVVFVTDGLPTVGETSPEKILRAVEQENAAKARIFTFGVGDDLDVGLLDRLAEATRGTRDYVANGESIEVVTGRFFRRVTDPVLSDVSLEWGAGVYDVYPTRLPDLFAGDQLVVFGRYREAGERSIKLKGRVGDRSVEFTRKATLRDGPGAEVLPRLWASRKVAFLLDEIRLHGRNKELVDEVVRLATRQGIVTPYTSRLVVEDGPGLRAEGASARDHSEADNDLPTEESLGEGGLADAPFEGPANSGLIGIGGGGAFKDRGGHRNLRAGGGGRRADNAVDDALQWLKAHQSPDGGWDAASFGGWCDGQATKSAAPAGAGEPDRSVGVTALSLLAYLGAGYTNRSDDTNQFGKAVASGVRFLKNAQDAEGRFGSRTPPASLSNHAQATLAVVEAYGMTGSSIHRVPAQRALDFLATSKAAYFGSKASDLEAVSRGSWAILALGSARAIDDADIRAGKPPSLAIDEGAVDMAVTWAEGLAAGASKDSPSAWAAEALARTLLRAETAATSPPLSALVDRAKALAAAGRAGALDLEAWSHLWLVANRAGAPAGWPAGPSIEERVADAVRQDGDACSTKGSADPAGESGARYGRVGATALAALICEAPYRYDGSPSRATPGSLPPAGSTGPAGRVDPVSASKELRKREEASSAPDAALSGAVRSVGGRSFRRDKEGRYVDLAYDGKAPLVPVVAWSDAWTALSALGDDVARCLSLGERVIVVVAGRAYEVVPAAAK